MSETDERTLGASGLTVPALGLGCMGMSAMYGAGSGEDPVEVIHRALDLGVSMLDTSDAYGAGANEELVGRAIAGRRDDVVLATKFGAAIPGVVEARGDRASVLASCDASLRRLNTDRIDLYYQHRVDFSVPVEETFEALNELMQAGKVLHVGICEASPERIRRAHAVCALSAVQTEWSLWSREVESSVLATLRELGIGMVAYAPLGRGFLTGTITSPGDLSEDDIRRARLPRFQPENLTKNLRLVRPLQQVAARLGASPAQVALAWVLAQGQDVVAIPGTRRVAYLKQNLAAAQLELPADVLAELDAAFPAGAAAGARYDDAAAAYIDA